MPKWANALIGGWDIGGLAIWESGGVMTASSGRYTALSWGVASWDNYYRQPQHRKRLAARRWRLLHRSVADYQLHLPACRRLRQRRAATPSAVPRFFNVDASLVKSFAITETKKVAFRAEAYNLFNNVDFANPSLAISSPASFGKISNVVNNPRLLQMALRFDF